MALVARVAVAVGGGPVDLGTVGTRCTGMLSAARETMTPLGAKLRVGLTGAREPRDDCAGDE